MLKAKIIYFEDLSKAEQEFQPDNGSGKYDASYIKITDADKTVMILSDAVEPEDATFIRDFNCVVDAINVAYKIGIRNGQKRGRNGRNG